MIDLQIKDIEDMQEIELEMEGQILEELMRRQIHYVPIQNMQHKSALIKERQLIKSPNLIVKKSEQRSMVLLATNWYRQYFLGIGDAEVYMSKNSEEVYVLPTDRRINEINKAYV